MLLKSIADFLLGIFDWIFGLIPDINLPILNTRADFFGPVANFFGYVDSFVDLDIVVGCIATIILIDNIGFLTRLLKFILNKFGIG